MAHESAATGDLEVSRLARNNGDWYRLLDLAGLTDTLIADADGVYHPALFNDRLLLGMKGTMSARVEVPAAQDRPRSLPPRQCGGCSRPTMRCTRS